ncbi:MAG: multiple sugar transport system permease protein, partial [Microbacteriaceae bacterium]|nr:multiple sugar transport system permease protein [Microbacteriaceae bacterium]
MSTIIKRGRIKPSQTKAGRVRDVAETEDRGIASGPDWRRKRVRFSLGTSQIVLLLILIITGLGPILWLAKSA